MQCLRLGFAVDCQEEMAHTTHTTHCVAEVLTLFAMGSEAHGRQVVTMSRRRCQQSHLEANRGCAAAALLSRGVCGSLILCYS